MLAMAAGKLGHPVAHLVAVVTGDQAMHESSVST
jgi:hypothetical protein